MAATLTDKDRRLIMEALDFYSDALSEWEAVEEVRTLIGQHDKIVLKHEGEE